MSRRGAMLIFLLLAAGGGCATTPRAGRPTATVRIVEGDDLIELDNGILSVFYGRADGTLSATHHKQGETLISGVKLAPRPGEASVVDVSDADGAGRAVRIEYADGRRDWISVWAGSPMVYVRMENRSSPSTARPEPARYAIDLGMGPFVGYDSGSNKFALESRMELAAELDPGESRLIGLRKVENFPVLLGATGQTAHRFEGVESQRWDADTDTLSGACLVTAGEPYELRIFANAWLRGEMVLSAEDTKAGVKTDLDRSGPFNRVTIESKTDRRVRWSVVFK